MKHKLQRAIGILSVIATLLCSFGYSASDFSGQLVAQAAAAVGTPDVGGQSGTTFSQAGGTFAAAKDNSNKSAAQMPSPQKGRNLYGSATIEEASGKAGIKLATKAKSYFIAQPALTQARSAYGFTYQSVLVDNSASSSSVPSGYSAGFSIGGPSVGWHTGSGCYVINNSTYIGSNFIYTRNATNTIENSATWSITIPEGNSNGHGYHVYAYIPSCYATTKHAVYNFYAYGGTGTHTVNQYNTAGWIYLGDIYCWNGCQVTLGDATGESYMSTYVGFDAMDFVAM